jgi:hypothetical protein
MHRDVILSQVAVIVELQQKLHAAFAEVKLSIADLPASEQRGVLTWQREEASLANIKSQSYTQQLLATAKRNLKSVEE